MTRFSQLITLTLFGSLLTSSWTLAQDNIILKNGSEIPAKVLEVSPGQIKYRRQDNPDGPIYSTGTTDVLLIRYANGTKDVLNAGSSPVGSSASAPTTLLGNTPVGAPIPTLHSLRYHYGLFSRYFTNETGERLNRSLVQTAFATQPDALEYYRRGLSLRRWSVVTGGTALALLGAGAIVGFVGDEGGRNGHHINSNDNTNTNGIEHQGGHGSREVGIALAGSGVLLGVTSFYLSHRATIQFRRAANRYRTQQSTSLYVSPSTSALGIHVALTF